MGEENGVDGWEMPDTGARTAHAVYEDEPVGEDGIDEEIEPGELEKKRRVPDEGDAEFAGFCEDGFVLAAECRAESRLCDELEEGFEAKQSPTLWMPDSE